MIHFEQNLIWGPNAHSSAGKFQAFAGGAVPEVWLDHERFRPQLKTKDALDTRGVPPDLGSEWLRSLVSQEQHQVLPSCMLLEAIVEEAFFCRFSHMNDFFSVSVHFPTFTYSNYIFLPTNFLSFHFLKTVTFPSKLSDILLSPT